ERAGDPDELQPILRGEDRPRDADGMDGRREQDDREQSAPASHARWTSLTPGPAARSIGRGPHYRGDDPVVKVRSPGGSEWGATVGGRLQPASANPGRRKPPLRGFQRPSSSDRG